MPYFNGPKGVVWATGALANIMLQDPNYVLLERLRAGRRCGLHGRVQRRLGWCRVAR